MFPRALDRFSRVLGHLPYSLMLKIVGPAMKSGLPPARREVLTVGITADERELLEATPRVSLVEIPDAGHFTLNQKPSEIATIVLDAIASTAPN